MDTGYRKLDVEASRAHEVAARAEGWGGCQGDKGTEPDEGQLLGGLPVGAQDLLNLDVKDPADGDEDASVCVSVDGDGGSR